MDRSYENTQSSESHSSSYQLGRLMELPPMASNLNMPSALFPNMASGANYNAEGYQFPSVIPRMNEITQVESSADSIFSGTESPSFFAEEVQSRCSFLKTLQLSLVIRIHRLMHRLLLLHQLLGDKKTLRPSKPVTAH